MYDKFLKSKTYEHGISYKSYRKLFESIKQRAKSQYYSKMILHYKDNIKKTWQIMKEVIGKGKLVNNSLPKHLILNNRNIFNQKTIASSFNEYFANVGPKLACELPQSQRSFEMYLTESDGSFEEVTLSDEEIKTAFFSLKGGKSPGFNKINYDIVKQNFNSLLVPLKYIFDLSLKSGTFPDKMKIARVTPVFKSGDTSLMTNYRPISVLPCFSKMLERIMYNRLYKYLIENNLFYCKQFGFQKGHSPEHAILQLVEQIDQSSEKNEFTLGVFVDLSKAFDTVDHQILFKKLEYYGIVGNNLRWFENYLKDRQQFISFENNFTKKVAITCGVPQGSILGLYCSYYM